MVFKAADNSRSAPRRSPDWRKAHPRSALTAAGVLVNVGGTAGRMNSGNFGVVMTGTVTTGFRPQAALKEISSTANGHASAVLTENASSRRSLVAIIEILPD